MHNKTEENAIYLRDNLTKIFQQAEKNDFVELLLDIDGTIAPIADRPEAAVIPNTTLELLGRLNSNHRCKTAVISGRSIKDCQRMLSGLKIDIAGNHGLEALIDGKRFVHPQALAARPLIRTLSTRLKNSLSAFPGIIIEDKGLTASVHYRQLTSGLDKKALGILKEEMLFFPSLYIFLGNKIWEIRPSLDWDKGKAAVCLLETIHGKNWHQNTLPIFAGDDTTDEDAFAALRKNGITVLISPQPRPTHAQYYLKNPEDVYKFLVQLEQIL